jgi:hypothetical protein
MRRLLVSLLSTATLLLGLSAFEAQAGCQNINLTNELGSFTGTLCISQTNLTLQAVAVVAATGTTYTVDVDAVFSDTTSNHCVSGTVTITDGTNTFTHTFSSCGPTTFGAAASFVGKSINLVMSQRPPQPPTPPKPVAHIIAPAE